MRSRIRDVSFAAIVVVGLAGCGMLAQVFATPGPKAPRELGPGEAWVPIELWEPINGVPVGCGGVGYEGEYRLHGSATDPRLVWMTFPDGVRHELAWPLGYSARFTPGLELLDETGRVVAREGTLVTGGCGTPQPGVLWVTPDGLTVDEMFNGSRGGDEPD